MGTDRPVVLVTGDPGGIPGAVVSRLLAEGHDVVFGHPPGADPGLVKEMVAGAAETEGRLLVREPDPADATAMRDLVRETETETGPLAAVVACAPGVGTPADPEEDWAGALAGLDTAYHLCRAVIYPFMKRKAGRVVTVSSPAGADGDPARPDLAAAAEGITGLLLSVAKECAGFGVRANAVLAGPAPDGAAADVADLVAFLVCDRAASVNGQVLRAGSGPLA